MASNSSNKNAIVMVLSPAKTMDLRPLSERDFDHDDVTADTIFQINAECDKGKCDATKTAVVCDAMKKKKKAELKNC